MLIVRPLFAHTILATTLVLLVTVAEANGCSVPVFRYALDRWAPDAYQLTIPKQVALTANVAPLVAQLQATPYANVEIQVADTSETVAKLQPPPPLDKPVWAGNLTPEVLQHLADSPLRRQILKKILSGDSAVWVLIESGNIAADNKAAAALEKRLAYIESVAKLPEIDPNDPTSNVGPGPALKVKFSVLRVSRSDPVEKILISMLTSPPSGDEPPPPANKPLAAAVFGRGKVLGLVNAEDLPTDTIDEMCLFLLGACSCEAKEANPGWDLLMTANWDAELVAIQQPPQNDNVSRQASAVAVTVTGAEPAKSKSNGNQVIAIACSTLVAGLGAGILLRNRRHPPHV